MTTTENPVYRLKNLCCAAVACFFGHCLQITYMIIPDCNYALFASDPTLDTTP
jgi:hypothetical protein